MSVTSQIGCDSEQQEPPGLNFETDDDSNLVNASFESTILNDVNNHINSNNLIVILKGEPYKLIENKIYHIITNDVFEIQVPKNLFRSKVEKDSPIDDEFDLKVADLLLSCSYQN